MELLQIREKEIFETLKKIKRFNFVIIGGYAVNAYTLPRFSIDCDIVVSGKELFNELKKLDYKEVKSNKINLPYHGEFIRYEKIIEKNFASSIDIFINNVIDRETKAVFDAKWIFKNSSFRILRGKTIAEELRLKIINIDSLIIMKFISCRNTDIRDIFMLMPQAKNQKSIKNEINKTCNFNERFNKIKELIISKKFRDNLQGVYGSIEDKLFEKYKKTVLNLEYI